MRLLYMWHDEASYSLDRRAVRSVQGRGSNSEADSIEQWQLL
jgi:hypothetical protein